MCGGRLDAGPHSTSFCRWRWSEQIQTGNQIVDQQQPRSTRDSVSDRGEGSLTVGQLSPRRLPDLPQPHAIEHIVRPAQGLALSPMPMHSDAEGKERNSREQQPLPSDQTDKTTR